MEIPLSHPALPHAVKAPVGSALVAPRARELRYYAVQACAADAFVTSDSAGCIVDWNLSAARIFGYSEAEIIGQPLTLLIPQRFQDSGCEATAQALFSGEPSLSGRTVELVGLRSDGSEFPLEASLAEWSSEEGAFSTSIIRDITDRKAAEAKILRQTKLYSALSQCNKAIVRCTAEEKLFPQICRAAVKFGGMKMACIGIIDTETHMVLPAASFGDDAEYFSDIDISADANSPFWRGPTGTAIRENKPFWCQDFLSDPGTSAWHERAAHCGVGAAASLPLCCNDVVVGAFSLFSSEANSFDEPVRDLLVEMAADVSFALDNFHRESQRRQAEDQRGAAEEKFRGLVEQAIAGIFIFQDGKLNYVNPRGAEIIGQGSADELIGIDLLRWVDPADRSDVADSMRRLLTGEALNIAFDFRMLRRDCVTIQVGLHATRATHEGRPAIIAMLQDISEKKRASEEIARYIAQLKIAFRSTVEVATIISEMRDPYTAGHERRVAEIAVAIGTELGLDANRLEGLQVAGHLHDIGKITIPSEILSRPGKLGVIEYMLIQGHARAGYDVLKGVEFPWPVAQVALQHHERMDGTGYPLGLKGEAILPDARIMAVADVVEAMSSHRPYRPGLGIEKALAEIGRGRGTVFDEEAADACLHLFREKGYQLPT